MINQKKTIIFSLILILLTGIIGTLYYHKDFIYSDATGFFNRYVDSIEIYRIQDSIRYEERKRGWEEERIKYRTEDSLAYISEPLITKENARKYQKALRKWLSFHEIPIDSFRLHNQQEISAERFLTHEDPESIYYREFEEEYQGEYRPQSRDYSPNRRRYINLRETTYVYKDERDGNWYWFGGDDCQEIRLVDLDRKTDCMFMFTGTSFMDGAFWVNNNCFILTRTGNSQDEYAVYVYDLANEIISSYRFYSKKEHKDYLTYDIESRGIITDYILHENEEGTYKVYFD